MKVVVLIIIIEHRRHVFLFFLCRALWIRHRQLRTEATSTSRQANMSRPSSATPRPSACVPKNRRVTCPHSTRTELQPTSSRFVLGAWACTLQQLWGWMAPRHFAILTEWFVAAVEMDWSGRRLFSGCWDEPTLHQSSLQACQSPGKTRQQKRVSGRWGTINLSHFFFTFEVKCTK